MRLQALMVSVLLSLTALALPAHADTAIDTNGVSLEGCPHQFPPGQNLASVDLVCTDGTHIGFIPEVQGSGTVYKLRRYRLRTEPPPVPLRETPGPVAQVTDSAQRPSATGCIRVSGRDQPVCGDASDPRTLPAGTIVESATSPGPTYTRIDTQRNSSGNYRWVSTGQPGSGTVVIVKPQEHHDSLLGQFITAVVVCSALEVTGDDVCYDGYRYRYGPRYSGYRYSGGYNPYRYRGGYSGTFIDGDGDRVSNQCRNPRAGSWGGCPR